MKKDQALSDQYRKKIEEYEDKGYARRLTDEESSKTTPRTWYLPHFVVVNQNKPGKIRLVFDAAAKSQGVSLNDRLLPGPDLYNSLVGILFKFRERAIGICGDLREMFHQVKIRKEDQCSQRFLWREMNSNQLITLEMQVMIFGAVFSPYVAQEIRNLNAREYESLYPEACEAITSKHYMDDYLDSVDTTEEAVQRAHEVAHVHRRGGFEIRNWIANSPEMPSTFPQDAVAPRGSKLNLGNEEIQRVLGVTWVPETDCFTAANDFPKLDRGLISGQKTPTKREVLKVVMSVFDPLGLFAVLTIRAKVILQDIWRKGIGWDEHISEDLQEKWKAWLNDLERVKSIRIPHHYAFGIVRILETELHVIGDASEQAFAAAAYLRFTGEKGIQTALVMAKTRVAPVKMLTIPRLELQAAVMSTRLAKFVRQQHTFSIKRTVYWTDSRTVLCWLRSDARRYQTFVAHRIVEILDNTDQTEWRWIPTKENVADEATRDYRQLDLRSDSVWFTGPAFLNFPEDEWPQERIEMSTSKEDLELKKEFCGVIGADKTPVMIDASRFSSWNRMVRTKAWVKRIALIWCKSAPKLGKERDTWKLTSREVEEAERPIIRQSQRESYPEDFSRLQKGQGISEKSKLLTLLPVKMEDGFIKMEGRVKINIGVGPETFNPIIMDGKHPITKLLVMQYHKKAGHHGRERVVNKLRQTFYIPKIRTVVKGSWNVCRLCKLRRAIPVAPRMAPLPSARCQPRVRPFEFTGVDYFGPLYVTIGRRREKRYGVLFSCLTIRAVHLEIAASLSTDSMIMALRRMIARRKYTRKLFSDNGTNMRGASEELKRAVKMLDQNKILRETSQLRMEWNFIPPAAPHMGGCWERLVRSVERALESTLNEQAPREETLQILFAEAEYSVNNRPLTHVSDDPADIRSITPNDIILPVLEGEPRDPETPLVAADGDLLRRQWRISQALADQFWHRWVKEYLPYINRRAKWRTQTRPLKIGDLVLIWDENASRNEWRRGRVVAVYPGKDGITRVVDVKTATGTYRRPVVKLCALEV